MFSNEIPKSFCGPKAGPGPHAEKGSLRSHDAAAHHRLSRSGPPPPDQILDPPLYVTKNYNTHISRMKYCNTNLAFSLQKISNRNRSSQLKFLEHSMEV